MNVGINGIRMAMSCGNRGSINYFPTGIHQLSLTQVKDPTLILFSFVQLCKLPNSRHCLRCARNVKA